VGGLFVKLLIIRHAIAVPRGTPGIPDDKRPLTSRGIRRFKSAAKGLARVVPRPDAILTSPWKRARQTAEIAAEAWGRLRPRDTAALAGGSFDALVRALGEHPAGATVAIVGHEPWLSAFLARVLGSGDDERFEFRKGGAALVEFAGRPQDGGRLVFYLSPRLLRALA
jgi:phosphohistidine phosphatase